MNVKELGRLAEQHGLSAANLAEALCVEDDDLDDQTWPVEVIALAAKVDPLHLVEDDVLYAIYQKQGGNWSFEEWYMTHRYRPNQEAPQ